MLRRELAVFGFLLLAHLIVLSAQARDPFGPADSPSRSLLRGTGLRLFGPVLRLSSNVGGFFGGFRDEMKGRRAALRRIEELEAENEELRRRAAELSGARAELQSLQRAMGASTEWHEAQPRSWKIRAPSFARSSSGTKGSASGTV